VFTLYTIGKVHEGIVLGIDITGHDPVGEIEAYKVGVQEGFDFRIEQ
jgi:hypothetical protein